MEKEEKNPPDINGNKRTCPLKIFWAAFITEHCQCYGDNQEFPVGKLRRSFLLMLDNKMPRFYSCVSWMSSNSYEIAHVDSLPILLPRISDSDRVRGGVVYFKYF